MKEDYAITISGHQIYEGEDFGEMQMTSMGTYREKNGKKYIMYKEYDEDDARSYRTALLKVEPGMVTMSRSGTRTKLILEKGQRNFSLYDTGFGFMTTLGVYTSELDVDLGERGGTVDVAYTVDVDSSLSTVNRLHIQVSPVPEPPAMLKDEFEKS